MNVNIRELVVFYLVFVFSTTCHEAAHAYFALRGGDRTAYQLGHVTLDPIPHIRRSPFGMVIVPLFGYLLGGVMIGWASVPVDPYWARRHPRRAALMSLAGPATNALLAVIAFVVLKSLVPSGVFHGLDSSSPLAALRMALNGLLYLNVALAVLNIIPFPPLDGAGVVEGLSPHTAGSFYERLRQSPSMQMIGLIVIWQLFPYLFDPILKFVLRLLH
ncbi:MAG TPA: site-2 protease family protein [Polyangiaceae bacterium]|jgi:Zn-dependent protease|nr:site-2 protease family protein [Polyangiaceae bacterium]